MIPSFDDPRSYLEVFDALARKWGARGRLDKLAVGGLTLADLRRDQIPLARILAETVALGQYEFSPLIPAKAWINGRCRVLHRPNLLDRVVLTVVARYLTTVAESSLSPALYSYRKGRSPWQALSALGNYLTRHRATVPTIERGVYVLRRDVQRYGESIDGGLASPLWPLIESALAADPSTERRKLGLQLVRAAIRQPVLDDAGVPLPLSRGVPTGSPIQPPCANLFLSSIDAFCTSVEGGFYSRFGDDILFCHPDREKTQQVSQELDTQLGSLGLTVKREKRQDLDFNGAGRRRGAVAGFRTCAKLEYLGATVDFQGQLGLKKQKAREFEREMRRRLERVSAGLANEATNSLVAALCASVRKAIVPGTPLAVSASDFLRYMATDRAQLRDLDFRLALIVAQLASGRNGPRAFRKLPYARLRNEGLPSLLTARDRSSKADRA